MAKCKAVKNGEAKQEGKKGVEFYINYKAQFYCYGVLDKEKGGILGTCKKCRQYFTNAPADKKRAAADERNRIL